MQRSIEFKVVEFKFRTESPLFNLFLIQNQVIMSTVDDKDAVPISGRVNATCAPALAVSYAAVILAYFNWKECGI